MTKKASKAKKATKAPAPPEQLIEPQVEEAKVEKQTQTPEPTATKPAKKAKQPTAPKKPSGAGAAIKLLLFKSPNLSVQEITDALGEAAPSKQTVMLIRYETRQALKLLAQEGLLREGFPPID